MASDLIDLKPDGTAVLKLAGKQMRLRRPTVGVLNDLDDRYTETVYGNQDLLEEHQEAVREAAEEFGFDAEHTKADAAGRILGYWQVVSAGEDWAKERTKTLTGWLQDVAEGVEASTGEDPSRSVEWRRAKRKLERTLSRQVQSEWFKVGRFMVEQTGNPDQLPDDDRDLDPMFGSDVLYRRIIKHWSTVPFV